MGATEWLQREEALTGARRGGAPAGDEASTRSGTEAARDVAMSLALALHQRSEAALMDGRVLDACDDLESALESMKRCGGPGGSTGQHEEVRETIVLKVRMKNVCISSIPLLVLAPQAQCAPGAAAADGAGPIGA